MSKKIDCDFLNCPAPAEWVFGSPRPRAELAIHLCNEHRESVWERKEPRQEVYYVASKLVRESLTKIPAEQDATG